MRISDWSSDVCSSDLGLVTPLGSGVNQVWDRLINGKSGLRSIQSFDVSDLPAKIAGQVPLGDKSAGLFNADDFLEPKDQRKLDRFIVFGMAAARSEEHTSELQSLMRISYAVFCLKIKHNIQSQPNTSHDTTNEP